MTDIGADVSRGRHATLSIHYSSRSELVKHTMHIKFIAVDIDFLDVRRSGQPATHWCLMLYETGHIRTMPAQASSLPGLVRAIDRLLATPGDLGPVELT